MIFLIVVSLIDWIEVHILCKDCLDTYFAKTQKIRGISHVNKAKKEFSLIEKYFL